MEPLWTRQAILTIANSFQARGIGCGTPVGTSRPTDSIKCEKFAASGWENSLSAAW